MKSLPITTSVAVLAALCSLPALGQGFRQFDPSPRARQMALCLAEHHSRYTLSDEYLRQEHDNSNAAIPLVVVPNNFHVMGATYTQYVRQCKGFTVTQTIGETTLARDFIAVCHLAPTALTNRVGTRDRGFTVYWDLQSGHVGQRPGDPPLGWYPPPFDLSPCSRRPDKDGTPAKGVTNAVTELKEPEIKVGLSP